MYPFSILKAWLMELLDFEYRITKYYHCMNDFINRDKELTEFNEIVSNEGEYRPKLVIYNAQSASGISYYFEYVISKLRQREKHIAIYIDGSINLTNTVFQQYLNQINVEYPDYVDIFYEISKPIQNRFSKERLFGATLEGIPFAGPLLREFVDQNTRYSEDKSSLFNGTDYGSVSTELFAKSLEILSNEFKVVFFIDNIQKVDNMSFSLIKSTVGQNFKNLNYVVSYSNNVDNDVVEGFSKRYPFTGLYDKYFKSFERPNAHFIYEYGKTKGKDFTYPQAESIFNKTKGQIYDIDRMVNDSQNFKSDSMFSPNQLEIINILRVANQPLKKSDILKIFKKATENFILNEGEAESLIEGLIEFKVLESFQISNTDHLINLKKSERITLPEIRLANRIRLSENMYNYYSVISDSNLTHSKTEIYPLLYRLSKTVRSDKTKSYALEIVKMSLSMGAEEMASIYLSDLEKYEINNYNDLLIVSAFLFNSKKYRILNDFLNKPAAKVWSNKRPIKILKAITYNRIRKHSDSERLISELLQDSRSKEEEVSLLIYLIGGKLHQNQVSQASQIYQKRKSKLKKADNYGYLLRNGSSSLNSEKAIKELKKAEKIFNEKQDKFGMATALNNMGVNYHRIRNYQDAKKSFERSLNLLENFGTTHLPLLLNNIGVFNLFENNLEKSMSSFLEAERLTNAQMPSIFISINKAILLFISDEIKEAFRLLDDLDEKVANYEVDRVRQKYYFNKLVLYACYDSSNLKERINIAVEHPLRENPETTLKKIEALKNGIDKSEVLDFIEPCYLAYWYHNPLRYVT